VLELPTDNDDDDDDDHSAGVEDGNDETDSRSSFDSTAEYEALQENWPSTPERTPAPEAIEMLFDQQQQQQQQQPLTQFPITPWNWPPEELTTPTSMNGDFVTFVAICFASIVENLSESIRK